MRRRFLDEFDAFWFDCLNGDSRETGKLTPDGKPDPSIFSTECNREGIRVGTAIGLMVRKATDVDAAAGRALPAFLGRDKARRPAGESGADFEVSRPRRSYVRRYEPQPEAANRYSFRPSDAAADYLAGRS